jgi:hypothetical protein
MCEPVSAPGIVAAKGCYRVGLNIPSESYYAGAKSSSPFTAKNCYNNNSETFKGLANNDE